MARKKSAPQLAATGTIKAVDVECEVEAAVEDVATGAGPVDKEAEGLLRPGSWRRWSEWVGEDATRVEQRKIEVTKRRACGGHGVAGMVQDLWKGCLR